MYAFRALLHAELYPLLEALGRLLSAFFRYSSLRASIAARFFLRASSRALSNSSWCRGQYDRPGLAHSLHPAWAQGLFGITVPILQ